MQHRRRGPPPPDERQSQAADPTPPVPRHPEQPVRRARTTNPRLVRTVRTSLQLRLADPADSLGLQTHPAAVIPRTGTPPAAAGYATSPRSPRDRLKHDAYPDARLRRLGAGRD